MSHIVSQDVCHPAWHFPHSKVRLRVPIGTSLSNLNLFVSEVQSRDLDQGTEQTSQHLVQWKSQRIQKISKITTLFELKISSTALLLQFDVERYGEILDLMFLRLSNSFGSWITVCNWVKPFFWLWSCWRLQELRNHCTGSTRHLIYLNCFRRKHSFKWWQGRMQALAGSSQQS